jgi:hypothetical protein
MRHIVFIGVGLVLAGIVALLAWVEFVPPPGRPNVSVTFLGYAKDSADADVVKIAVSNLSSSSVLMEAHYSTMGSQLVSPGPAKPVLPSGGFEVFTVRPPTNGLAWQLQLFAAPDAISARLFKLRACYLLKSFGLRPRYQLNFHVFLTEAIWPKPKLIDDAPSNYHGASRMIDEASDPDASAFRLGFAGLTHTWRSQS